MSQNNKIKNSDRKFIRIKKASIRRQFSDFKKQEEMINELYKNILKPSTPSQKVETKTENKEVKIKKSKVKTSGQKPKIKEKIHPIK